MRKRDKMISLKITLKTINYLGINLTKVMKELCTKNFKIPMKEIKEDTNKWKNSLCS